MYWQRGRVTVSLEPSETLLYWLAIAMGRHFKGGSWQFYVMIVRTELRIIISPKMPGAR